MSSPETQRILAKLSFKGHTRRLVKEAMPHVLTKKFMDENPEFIEKKVDDILIIPTGPTPFKAQMGAWMRYNSYRKLKEINIPTLIMYGKQDILVPPRNGDLLAVKIPNAEKISFDSNAHMIYTEEPDKFNVELLKFLK